MADDGIHIGSSPMRHIGDVILFIEEQQVWYDTSLCDEYTVDELTPELLNISLDLTAKEIYRSKKVII